MQFVELECDKNAYEQVQSGRCADEVMIAAATRYASWMTSSSAVRSWTGHDDRNMRTQNRLNGLLPVSPTDGFSYTHTLLGWLNDPAKWLKNRDEPTGLLKLARYQHDTWIGRQKMIWITDESPATHSLTDLLQRLGLYHFRALKARQQVVRFCYQLDETCPSYKPDWRHGFAGFYFAGATAFPKHGMTRSLQDAGLACKEWVVAAEAVNVSKHLKAVEVLDVERDVQLDAPLPIYWENLKNEISHATRISY